MHHCWSMFREQLQDHRTHCYLHRGRILSLYNATAIWAQLWLPILFFFFWGYSFATGKKKKKITSCTRCIFLGFPWTFLACDQWKRHSWIWLLSVITAAFLCSWGRGRLSLRGTVVHVQWVFLLFLSFSTSTWNCSCFHFSTLLLPLRSTVLVQRVFLAAD